MIGFLTMHENLPFVIALAVVVGVMCAEALLAMIGASAGEALDGMIPDIDADQLLNPLSWLGFGRAPAFVVVTCLATLFGLSGLAIQGIAGWVGLGPLQPMLASLLAMVAATPASRVACGLLARILPRDETYVADMSKVVGRIGRISQGTAETRLAAECSIPDGFGGVLRVQAIPDRDTRLPEGTQVIVVRRDGSRFVVAPLLGNDAAVASDDIPASGIAPRKI